jgi:putative transposase
MPRRPRPDIVHVPLHVVQRGHNRQACFLETVDFHRYLIDLRRFAVKLECAVHAYVLMTNHVHLLLTPSHVDGMSRLMHALGSNYVPYFNRRYSRTGTLWERRPHVCVISNETYLLRCYRYIEQNPLRARMVSDPVDYRWSSAAANALGAFDPLITPQALYFGLGATPERRLAAYRDIVRVPVVEADLDSIRIGLIQQKPLE